MNSRSNRRDPIHKTYGEIMGLAPNPPPMTNTQPSQQQRADTPYLNSLRNNPGSSVSNEACINITSNEQLRDVLRSGMVVLDIWADWCGPCKKCAPDFEELARSHKANGTGVKFAKVIVEQFMEWTGMDVSSVPVFMFFYNGKKVSEVYGYQKVNGVWEGVAHINKMINIKN